MLARVRSFGDSSDSTDPEYVEGLRAAVSAGLDFGIEAVGRSEASQPRIPTALLSQARLAARHGVGLETVLRRYLASYTLFGDFLIEESAKSGALDAPQLKRLLRILASLLDRLIAAVSEEYAREERVRPGSADQRRAALIECLLAGQRLDASELDYDFEVTHLALVAQGSSAAEPIEALTRALDARLLLVCPEEQTTWAWLGRRRALGEGDVNRLLRSIPPEVGPLALGEPGDGLAGWRLGHRQARAALPVALLGPKPHVRYREVALVSSLLQDDLLATSLRRIYLDPLCAERDGGAILRSTLRAYLAAGRNVSSAAAALKVKRHTVANRVRLAEERIGMPLESCMAELDAVLRLEDLRVRGGGPIWPLRSCP